MLVTTGLGTTSLVYGSTVAAGTGTPTNEQGLASGLLDATPQVGAAVGVAVLLSSTAGAAAASHWGQAAGYRTALGWAAGLAIVAAILGLGISSRRGAEAS